MLENPQESGMYVVALGRGVGAYLEEDVRIQGDVGFLRQGAVVGGRAEPARPYSSSTCSPSRGSMPFDGSRTKPRGRRR